MDTVWKRRAVSYDEAFLRDSNDIETVDDIKPSQSSIGGLQWERNESEPSFYPFYSDTFPKLFFANTTSASNMDSMWKRGAFLRDSNDIETVEDIKPSQSSIEGWQWESENEPDYNIISTTPISISTSFTTTYTLSFVACEPHWPNQC